MLKFLRTFAMAAAMMLPFAMQAQNLNESFDGTAWPPDEWTATNVSGTISWARYTSNTRNSSAACASANYASNGHENYLITPQLAPVDGDTLTFYVSAQSYGGTTLTIEVSTATNATSDFTTTLATYTTGSSGTLGTTSLSTYVEKKVDLSAYDGQQIYVAFHVVDDDGSRINLEDVSGPAIVQPSCFKVTDLAIDATQTSSSSLTLTWTDTRNSGASYDVYTITPSDTTLLGNATDTFYTATGLDAATSYVFGVKTNCGGGDVAEMMTVSGRTACVTIDVDADNPFTEGFEGTTFPPDCWSIAHTAGSSTNTWIRNTSTSSVHTGSASAQLQDQSAGNKNNLVTPVLNIPEANGYQVSFWIYRSTTSYTSKTKEGVKVWVNTNPDTVGGTPLMHIRRSATQGEITETATGWYQYSAVIPTSGEMYVIFEGISEYGAATYIDDIVVEEVPSCLAVTLPQISAATNESLTLTWNDAANASATYSVYMLTPSDTTLLQSGVSDTFYVVENLDANTAYTFGVVADCGGGDLAEMVVISGRTACAAIATLPYNMGFEESDLQGTTNADLFPFCWTRINTLASGTYTYYPYAYNYGTPHDGSRHLYFYAYSYGTYADTTGFVMPALDVDTYPMNGNRVTFWAKVSSTTPYTVLVGTMTNPADRSTFTLVESVSVTATSYTKYAVSLATAAATDAYVAFIVPKVNSTMYIDDVTLEELPSCGDITGVAVAGATAESITLRWNTVEGANGYTVYNMSDSSVLGTTPDTTYEVTGLDANTVYNFGVQSNCTGGDGALATVSGRTSCAAYDLPFTENFSATLASDPCWRGATGTTADEVLAGTALTLTANNQWTYATSTSNGLEAGHYYVNIYGTGCKKWMITPEIDLTTASNPLLTFGAAFTVYTSSSSSPATGFENNATQKFMVLVSTNNGQTWAVASDIALTSIASSSYVPQYVSLASYAGETVRIAFYAQSTVTGGDNNLHIDNINIEESTGDICFPVSGLTVDATQTTSESITLKWVSDGSSFVVLNMADTTVAATVSDTTATIENLTANTSYTFGVVNDCGSETSDTVLITVRTACGAIALPYTEDFESGIDCWTMIDVATNTNVVEGASNAYSGTHAFKFSWNTNPPQYLISPELEGGEDGVQVSLMYKVGGNFTESFALGYSTTTNEVSAFTWLTEQTGLTNQTYEAYSDYLPAGTKFVAVKYTANDQYILYIDSMVFSPMDAGFCFPVTGLTVDTASANEVTISWSGDAANYSIYNGTTYVGSTADTFYTVNGLTASTEYTFGVTSVCSATDSADMVTVIARTDCEGGSCNITIASAGYGLMGASIDVMQNGSLVANVTDASYAPFSTAVSVCANVPVTLVYHLTPYDYEEYVSFTVSDGAGTVLYTCAEGNGVALTEGQTLLTIANACPTCLPVTDLAVDTVETTSVTISWSGTAASYNVYNGTTYVATVSTNSYTFTGLSAAMNYTFGVVALCDDEDSSAMATIVASTECGIISTFPYTQSFDAAPACWATIDADGDGYNWENLQGAMHSASYDNSVGVLTPDNWLITPQFQLGAGNSYEVTWNANPQDASYPAEHYGLYVSTNSTIDTANFTMLQEWTLTSAGNTPVVDLSAYSGQTIYLALRHWNCSDQYRIAIDNFELREQAGANQVTITLSQNNPMYGSVAGGGVYTIGDNVTVTATPSAGYQFSKWINSASVTVSTDNPYTFVASTDTALQAVFVSAAATTYDVVVTVNDSTMGTATGSGTYTSGDVVVMTATANPGYHFVNWTQNNTVLSTNNPFSMSATSNTAAYPIIANFEADMVETPTYTVTVNVNDATMGHVDGVPTAAVDSGAVVNLTAVPESGYHFVSWSNGLTTAAISLIVTSDTTVTATFEANPANTYTVAVSVNDAAMGHVDGIPTEPVTAGTVVNLTAVADAGYHFVDWSNGLTTAAISITVTSDTTLVANFEADPVEPTYYTVTVVYDATMGTVDGIPTEPVTSDDDITLTARANEGYVFKGWVIGTDTMSTEAMYTFHATDDVTIEAVFAAKTGIADVDMANVKVYSVNDVIYVNGAEGHQVYLFDVNGRVLNHSAKAGEHVEFRVANTGVYLVKVGNAAAKRVVVAR